MKNYKIPYITSAAFGGVGVILWLIVICEKLFNKAVSPSWVKVLQVLGIIGFAIALFILILIVVASLLDDKKTSKAVKVSDEEILSKYKSRKNK